MGDLIQESVGPQNHRGHTILGVSIAFGVIEIVAVALRFLARRRIGARWRIDDWLILAALVPNYAMIIIGGFRGLSPNAITRSRLKVSF